MCTVVNSKGKVKMLNIENKPKDQLEKILTNRFSSVKDKKRAKIELLKRENA